MKWLNNLIWGWYERRRSKWLEEDPEHRMNAWEYSQWVKTKYENRLVYDAELAKAKREPMVEIYTTLRKEYKNDSG
jgi:hypothetical protein